MFLEKIPAASPYSDLLARSNTCSSVMGDQLPGFKAFNLLDSNPTSLYITLSADPTNTFGKPYVTHLANRYITQLAITE